MLLGVDLHPLQIFVLLRGGDVGTQQAFTRFGSMRMVRGWGTWLRMSMTPSTTSPAPSSSTSSQARWTAGRVFMGSRPFSNLALASVRMPRPGRLADAGAVEAGGLKDHVHSIVYDLAVLAAHDARQAHGPGLVGDDQVVGSELAHWPSRVVSSSPSSARRTMILPPFT